MATGATGTVNDGLREATRLLREDPKLAALKARAMVHAYPGNADAYRLLGAALRQAGEVEEAEGAELQAISASTRDPVLQSAAKALLDNDLPRAEPLLRGHLSKRPTDVAAIRMLAELAGRIGRERDSETLLRRAIELAPGFTAARANLASLLYRQNRTTEALDLLEELLLRDSANPVHQNLKAAALGRLGAYEEAVALYEAVVAKLPNQPKVWMSYGHALKTIGRQQEAIRAYRRSLALAPALGEVWWSLANLKTVSFEDDDVAVMAQALEQPGLGIEDRFHLHFALGRAFEERKGYEASFGHYAEGNRLRAGLIDHDPRVVTAYVDRLIQLFTPKFFSQRKGSGCDSPDPIFIIGMPRSGSTLIEQILASHPLIEGTMELPDLPVLARRVGRMKPRQDVANFGDTLAQMSNEDLATLGREYLERTRIQRRTERPYFIDKLPNNWLNVGLIRLILPNAKIIDARRHPLDCGFSNFKQHYARGQNFSYALESIGLYYADYVRLMRHFDLVLEAPIHRVIHEKLIDDPDGQVRLMLDYLGLPFDPACLRFHENERPVRTASSEQVRRPINRDGVGQWKPFEPWLEPLKGSLGKALQDWSRS